jgi:subtilisin family serine protease
LLLICRRRAPGGPDARAGQPASARLSRQQIDHDVSLLQQAPADWQAAYQQVLALLGTHERPANAPRSAATSLVSHVPDLRYCWVRVENPATLQALKASPLVRYLAVTYQPALFKQLLDPAAPAPEPAQGESQVQLPQTIGCGGFEGNRYGPESRHIRETEDLANVGGTNALIPWNYRFHNIQQAWDTKGVTGQGVGLFIFDTGLNPNSTLVRHFNRGTVRNRTLINRTSRGDNCGHGTTLAGVLAGPRQVGSKATIGVAYGAGLVAYRGTDDVIIDTQSEIDSLSRAFSEAASGRYFPGQPKIISMSLGGLLRLSAYRSIEEGIKLAYNAGILIFCAAGTAPESEAALTQQGSAVPKGENLAKLVFPANFTYEVTVDGQTRTIDPVVVVSGVRREARRLVPGRSPRSGFYGVSTVGCENCVLGKTVDFVIVMEKPRAKGRYVQSMGWPNDDESTYPTIIGGSSVATATMAGIAALVWSKAPRRSREQVLTALQQTAYLGTWVLADQSGTTEINIPNGVRREFQGWGLPDAVAAINYLLAMDN